LVSVVVSTLAYELHRDRAISVGIFDENFHLFSQIAQLVYSDSTGSEMADKERMTAEFMELTNADAERANFFLESSGWDVQV